MNIGTNTITIPNNKNRMEKNRRFSHFLYIEKNKKKIPYPIKRPSNENLIQSTILEHTPTNIHSLYESGRLLFNAFKAK